MVSLAEVPEVEYTNEQIIDRLFSYLNEGDIQEVVERSLETEETDKGGGIDKILQLRYSQASGDEEELEFTRELDDIGKFAILHRHLKDEDDVTEIDSLSADVRSTLEEGEFIQARSRISSTPVSEIRSKIDDFLPYAEIFDVDTSFEDDGEVIEISDIRQLLEQMEPGEDIYQLDVSTRDSNGDIVFSDDGLEGLVSEYTEYYVLGRVEYIYEEGEEEWLIDIMDLMPGNDRESRKERRIILKQFTSFLSEGLKRDIDESDLTIGYPDIRIRPVAIYLY